MELGRSAWIRRERLERIAMAERDRRAGRTALAIAALGDASEWPARAVLALALLPESEGAQVRRILEEGLDIWALESGLAPLDELETTAPPSDEAPPDSAFEEFQIELDRPIEASELERAFAEAEAQVEEMHDVNRVAERVLFDEPLALAEPPEDELDPLEASARAAFASASPRPMDAATVPSPTVPPESRFDVDFEGGRDGGHDGGPRSGRPSREVVLATLERWLQNLESRRAGRLG